MTLLELRNMARLYARDSNAQMFKDVVVTAFVNQGIQRIRQYKIFEGMTELSNDGDIPALLPLQYHYMLALFAASRCFEMDERYYESVERRNEFESLLETIIGEIQAGNLLITDGDGQNIEDSTCVIDYIVDEYFNVGDEDATIL